MKTETKIAEENVKKSKILMDTAPLPSMNKESFKVVRDGNKLLGECQTHKASLQRFLEFLEDINQKLEIHDRRFHRNAVSNENFLIGQKITDLKKAIKKYDEAGI